MTGSPGRPGRIKKGCALIRRVFFLCDPERGGKYAPAFSVFLRQAVCFSLFQSQFVSLSLPQPQPQPFRVSRILSYLLYFPCLPCSYLSYLPLLQYFSAPPVSPAPPVLPVLPVFTCVICVARTFRESTG